MEWVCWIPENLCEPAMFRAIFDYIRDKIRGDAWKQKCSQMVGLQLLFWTISKFSSGIWRTRGPNIMDLHWKEVDSEIQAAAVIVILISSPSVAG